MQRTRSLVLPQITSIVKQKQPTEIEETGPSKKENFAPPKDSENNTPSCVGKYQIIRILGKGCFGKVLLGKDPDGKKYAIKYVHRISKLDLKVRRIINREICLLKLLRHPNIIQTFEVVEESAVQGDFVAVVMENIEHGELFDYINENGALSETLTRKWFQQLVSALDYCQKVGDCFLPFIYLPSEFIGAS